jgi:hypothetical protein
MSRYEGRGAQPLQDAELSVDLLQRTYPQILSSWVSVGIYAVFLELLERIENKLSHRSSAAAG